MCWGGSRTSHRRLQLKRKCYRNICKSLEIWWQNRWRMGGLGEIIFHLGFCSPDCDIHRWSLTPFDFPGTMSVSSRSLFYGFELIVHRTPLEGNGSHPISWGPALVSNNQESNWLTWHQHGTPEYYTNRRTCIFLHRHSHHVLVATSHCQTSRPVFSGDFHSRLRYGQQSPFSGTHTGHVPFPSHGTYNPWGPKRLLEWSV